MSAALSAADVLARLPQKEPFRFVDEILEIDPDHVVAAYRWREDADFYRGHFPGNPVTPGVLLVESMAQAAVVALGIYLLELEAPEEAGKLVTLFTDVNVEFSGLVRPGQRVVVRGQSRLVDGLAVDVREADGTKPAPAVAAEASESDNRATP